ncbi:MAG: hypothetical protein GXP27_08425 [Planctomycetes bacterium]|nr:hypothetical protein [Planctomycetota bacterium]
MPNWSEATLHAGQLVVRARRFGLRWPYQRHLGNVIVRVKGATVEALDGTSGRLRWRAECPASAKLVPLADRAGVLYLWSQKEERQDGSGVGGITIEQLSLADGSWLKSHKIPLSKKELARQNRPQAALPLADGLLVLTRSEQSDFPADLVVSYRLTKVGNEIEWSRLFPAAGNLPLPDAFLLGSLGPSRDYAGIRGLSLLGSDVLVCAGPLEDLLVIDPSTGAIKWRIPRIWEYRRGFTGPSVWSYHLGRYGMLDYDLEVASTPLDKLEAENEEQRDYFRAIQQRVHAAKVRIESQQCSLFAGPVIVPRTDMARYSIFVVTAQSENDEWPGYLSSCVAYEVTADGRPIGVVTLPRLVHGAQVHVHDGAVVWIGEGSAIARLWPSEERGNRDLTIDVDWWRFRFKPAERKAWLRQGAWPECVAFDKQWILTVREGGFVESPESRTIQFPLALLDLNTYAQHDLTLRVPFRGRVSPPKTNYSHSEEGWVTWGKFPIELTGLELGKYHLDFTLVHKNRKYEVTFDRSHLVPDD